MLTYNLNNRRNLSKYVYLYQCIRQDILNGTLKKGEKLPSKRALAEQLKVGVITVANAYAQLLTEGYIEAVEKKGYFVLDFSGYEEKKSVRLLPAGTGRQKEKAWQDAEPPAEREFFVDFKANRIGLKHFPASRWNYYMREALSLQDDILLKTVPYNGLYILRRAIAEYLARTRAIEVPPSRIIVGAGTEYLYGRLIQLFGRDCIFASEDPGYKKFASIAASYGNAWNFIPIDEKGLRVDQLEASGADAVHVSPMNHFPTGIVMPVSRRVELFDWLAKKDSRYIIEDDYDSEFRYSGKLILPLYAEDLSEKVIYINTFSKTLVPSLRISYMILPPALMARYEETLRFYSCTVSSFEQYTLARFIDEGELERHISRMRNFYKKQRKEMLEAIRESPLSGISVIHENNAGTHFLLEVKTSLSEAEIRRAGDARDMMLSMGSDYRGGAGSFEKSEGTCTLVINYAAIAAEKIREAVRRLALIFCGEDGKRDAAF